MNAETREYAKRLLDQAAREKTKTQFQRSKERNDEIVRQFVENGIHTEQIADLMGMLHYRVREILRKRGIDLGTRPLRLQRRTDCRGSMFAVPASVAGLVLPDARFACELVEDGILYRRVEGEAA